MKSSVDMQHGSESQPGFTCPSGAFTLAVSVQWHTFPERFDWVAKQGLAMAYTPDPDNLNHISQHVSPYVSMGIPVRHHAYFPGYEIGDTDEISAERAMKLHFQTLDALKGIGEPLMTVHVGLTPGKDLDHDRVVTNLSRLVQYGSGQGVKVCLENLRFGATSHPETVLEWTEKSRAGITMDIGHAVSCERVLNRSLSVPQIIDMFSSRLEEVHLYEYETNTHHAPFDMSVLGPIVDRLLDTGCRWWTIELESQEDILHTRNLIFDYVSVRKHLVAV